MNKYYKLDVVVVVVIQHKNNMIINGIILILYITKIISFNNY